MFDKTQENANPPLFEGTVYTIRIKSNYICYGPCPEPDDEVEQHLTVTEEGKVSFTSYCWGDGGKYKKAREQNFKIRSDIASYILKIVGDYFSADNEMNFTADVGSWEMDMSNTDEKSFHFNGSLYPGVSELDNISSIMRNNLNMPDLLAFDGDSHKDRIDKLVIDYHRVTKIKPKVPFNPEIEYATWDYSEHFTLDRASESLEHIQNIGSGCMVSRKYHVEDGLSAFLDDHYSSGLLSNIIGNPPDVIDNPLETKDYQIAIDYLYGGQRIITGSFDKNGLPEDFPELAEDIMNFMCFYGMGEILNPSVYRKAKRKNSDYTFCSVEFDEGSKSYYYLTEDDSLSIGDFVFVPVGKDGHTAIVEIVNIEYFPEDKVPFPLDKVKRIIRKSTGEDFETTEANNQENESLKLKNNSMLPFGRFVLCNEETSRAKINVWAELSEGCLKISGQDFGEAAEEVFDEDEYEYYYDFDWESTEHLFALLTPKRQNIKEMLLQKFGGINGCHILREFCDANGIAYKFFSC